jgi:hypothetical protein
VRANHPDESLPVRGEFVPVLQSLLDDVAPSSRLMVIKDLVGGRSGAEVLLVDLEDPSGACSGQFVLKLGGNVSRSYDEPDEGARHRAAENWNDVWASRHIPKGSRRD